jgi:hypothetical protein
VWRAWSLSPGATPLDRLIGGKAYTEPVRDGETQILRRYAWLLLMALTVAACGGGSTATTTVQATTGGLTGVHFEVHENPG